MTYFATITDILQDAAEEEAEAEEEQPEDQLEPRRWGWNGRTTGHWSGWYRRIVNIIADIALLLWVALCDLTEICLFGNRELSCVFISDKLLKLNVDWKCKLN